MTHTLDQWLILIHSYKRKTKRTRNGETSRSRNTKSQSCKIKLWFFAITTSQFYFTTRLLLAQLSKIISILKPLWGPWWTVSTISIPYSIKSGIDVVVFLKTLTGFRPHRTTRTVCHDTYTVLTCFWIPYLHIHPRSSRIVFEKNGIDEMLLRLRMNICQISWFAAE